MECGYKEHELVHLASIHNSSSAIRLTYLKVVIYLNYLFQASSPNHKKEPCAGQNVEIGRVVEWLRNLGLSKYEEVFIREEVDWETLQWLTEEVHSVLLFRCKLIFKCRA